MRRVTITFLMANTLMFLSLITFGQQAYKTGVGLRGGYPSGVTVKHFFNNPAAIEGVVSFGWGGIGITGLYQIHNQIPDAPGFAWYYGGGAHFATANVNKGNPWAGDTGGNLFLGLDGVIGAEYVFADAPISISLDVLPILNIFQDFGVWFNSGLSIRYVFK